MVAFLRAEGFLGRRVSASPKANVSSQAACVLIRQGPRHPPLPLQGRRDEPVLGSRLCISKPGASGEVRWSTPAPVERFPSEAEHTVTKNWAVSPILVCALRSSSIFTYKKKRLWLGLGIPFALLSTQRFSLFSLFCFRPSLFAASGHILRFPRTRHEGKAPKYLTPLQRKSKKLR